MARTRRRRTALISSTTARINEEAERSMKRRARARVCLCVRVLESFVLCVCGLRTLCLRIKISSNFQRTYEMHERAEMETPMSREQRGRLYDPEASLRRCATPHRVFLFELGYVLVRLCAQKNEAACVGLLLECACES